MNQQRQTFLRLAIAKLSLQEVEKISKSGKSAEDLAKEILDLIAAEYFRPLSPEELAEILREIVFRDQLSLRDAVYNWADDKDEKGYDLEALKVSSYTCCWGAVVDNLLPRQPGFSSASAVCFGSEEQSFQAVLEDTAIFRTAYHADVRIYALPLDFDQDELARYTIGEIGVLVANLPYADAEDNDHWIVGGTDV